MKPLEEIIKEISKENTIDEIKNALRKKDLDAYSKWKEDGFNVNHLFYGQDTLLHLAAENDSIEIVETLIKNGANVNAIGHFEETPLHHAARFGEVEVMKILIKNRANVNAVDEVGDTPLHTAVQEAPRCLKTAIVKVLTENRADVNVVNGYNEQTPLHFAVTLSYGINTVRILIENRANVNAVDSSKNTPLHLTAKYNYVEIAQTLIENGANINAINEYDQDTPLHLAAQNNHLEVVKYLIDKGADINAKNIKRKVPLDCAKEKGYEEIVEYLMDKMAKMPTKENKALPVYQNEDFDKVNEEKEGKSLKEKGKCSIQSYQRQQGKLLKFVSYSIPNIKIRPVRQGLYLRSFEGSGVKIDGKCVAITRGLTQALFLQGERSFLGNLEISAGIYERIAQGKQISKREEREVFAFSKLLNNFDRQLDSSTNSLPSKLIQTQGYKTLDDLSSYIAGIKGDFAIHLVTSNHVVAVYRTGDNYAYFDCNTAFVSGLENIDQLIEVVEKGADYEMGEKGLLVERFDVDKANNLLPEEDKRTLAKEIKTEHQLLAKQDKELGPIKSMVNRVQLHNFGTKINVEGSVPLLINADINLDSKSFSDYLSAGKMNITAREYLANLKNSKNLEKVVQATKTIPFIGSKREIEEVEQTRKPLLELARGTINFILAAVSLSRSEPKKMDNKPETYLNDPIVDNQLQKSPRQH